MIVNLSVYNSILVGMLPCKMYLPEGDQILTSKKNAVAVRQKEVL